MAVTLCCRFDDMAVELQRLQRTMHRLVRYTGSLAQAVLSLEQSGGLFSSLVTSRRRRPEQFDPILLVNLYDTLHVRSTWLGKLLGTLCEKMFKPRGTG